MAPPTDAYQLFQYHMINAHETFKRGHDTILSLLDEPPTHDLRNFLGYCEAWAASIECHHDTEEAVLFPFLSEKMDFSGEVEQHKVIHEALGKLLAIIHDAQTNPSKFDHAEMNALMTTIKEPLFAHLDEEVNHLSASKLKEAGFAEREILDLETKLETYARSNGDPFLLVPYMRSHTPTELKKSWPQMPWIVRNMVIPYILAMKHRGYWKYAPYTMS